MCKSIEWAINRDVKTYPFLSINIGKDSWNFTVKEIAEAIKKNIPKLKLSFTSNASPDKRSYKVDFSLFKSMAPNHQPTQKLSDTIKELADGITNSNFRIKNFRKSYLVRLNTLNYLKKNKLINSDLNWIV